MSVEAVGGGSSASDVAAQWAAQQAAEAARQRAAAEAARRAAEAAREAARKAAEAARKAQERADAARRAAERAEARADESGKPHDIDSAKRQRAQVAPAEEEALKQAAIAHMKDKDAALAESKADDAAQGRAANAPSAHTRAAQAEADAARETASVYDGAPDLAPDAKQATLKNASQDSRSALDRANAAMNKVVDAYNNGDEPSDAQVKAVNDAANDWLDSTQHEMRLAALDAESNGKDVKAAVNDVVAKATKSLDHDGVFETKKMGVYLDKSRDQVMGESGAVRQVRSEQYTALKAGQKQLADARKKLPELAAAAKAAEKRADGFSGTPRTDSQIDAKNQAQQAAIDARAKADAAKHEVDGLTLAYEGHTDDKGRWTPGSVPADYDARVADIKVKELGDRYQTLQTQGAGAKELAKAGQAWDAAIDDQRLAHADLDVANTQIDLADATVERDAAQAPVDTLKPDAKSSTSLFLQTAPIGTTTLQSSSLDGSLLQPPAAKSDKPTLAEMSAAAQAANGRYEDAKTKAQHAIDAQTEAYNDLTSPDENTAAKLDTSKWLGRDKDINDALANAKDDVQKKEDALNQARGTGKSDDVIQQDLVALGKAKQSELTAQADADTLNKMRELRDLQRRQASGEKIDEQDLRKARQAARDALQHSIEAGPELMPENEAKARDTLKTQTAALKDQDAKVLAAQKAYDHAAGTKDEAARLKDLQDAKTQRGTLDRQVRNLQTTLDKIDADRLALAADADYKQHGFPKTSTAWDTDAASGRADEYTVLPDGYDLTSSILPGDHGKPKADGLPVGLKSDDVEVKKENGKWVAHFKADSEQIGYNEKTGALYVHKGDTLTLDPTAAEVWDAHAKRDSASKARDDFLQEMKDIAPTAAQLGPDGQPIAGLGLSEDLGARRAAVQKKISDYTKSARHDPGPEPDDIRIARLELTAIDAAQEWQQTDETRAGQDAAQRAGLDHTFADGKSPKDIADNQRLAAKQARQEWLDAINKSKLDQATAQQKDAKAAHDKWKAAHPYLIGSERDSDTWKALQRANGGVDLARRQQTAGANVQADIDNKKFIADHLTPTQRDDPAALYDLFMQNPQVMAQSIINQHYITYGSQPLEMSGRMQLSNEVGIALGWKSDLQLDSEAPEDAKELRRSTDLFTHLTKEQRETHKSVVDKIAELGGDRARVTVLPVVYGLKDAGIVQTALFKVETKHGGTKFVDDHGREYSSVRDYRANNTLPVEGVHLAMPEDGDFTLDDKGNVKLFTGDARTETGWETFRRNTHLDVVMGVAGLVAGTILAVGSLGTLSAPGALLMAASITMLATSAYGITTSAQSLINEADHGVDINPISNRQARMDWLNLTLSAAAVPGVASGTKAIALGMRAANAAKAADEAATLGNTALQEAKTAEKIAFQERAANVYQPGKWTQRALTTGNVVATEENARYMADMWSQMTPGQRSQQMFMLGMSVSGFASPIFAKGYVGVHNGVKAAFKGSGETTSPETAPTAPAVYSTTDGQEPTIKLASDEGGEPRTSTPGERDTSALDAYREQPDTGNVTPLFPHGAPEVPPEPHNAPIAPVIQLPTHTAPSNNDPTSPAALPAVAGGTVLTQQQLVLRLVAGGESDPYPIEVPDAQQPVLKPVPVVNAHAGQGPSASAGGTPPAGGSSPSTGTPGSGSSAATPTGGSGPGTGAQGAGSAETPQSAKVRLRLAAQAAAQRHRTTLSDRLDLLGTEPATRAKGTLTDAHIRAASALEQARSTGLDDGHAKVDAEADGSIASDSRETITTVANDVAQRVKTELDNRLSEHSGRVDRHVAQEADNARHAALVRFDEAARSVRAEDYEQIIQSLADRMHGDAVTRVNKAADDAASLGRSDIEAVGARVRDDAAAAIARATIDAVTQARTRTEEELQQALMAADNEINALVLVESPKAEGAIDSAAAQAADVHKASVNSHLGTALPAGRQAIDAGAAAAVAGHDASIGTSARRAVDQIQDDFQLRGEALANETQSRLDQAIDEPVRTARQQLADDVGTLSRDAKSALRTAAGSGKGATARLAAALPQAKADLETAIAGKGRDNADVARSAVETEGATIRTDFGTALATTHTAAVADARTRAPRLSKLPGLDEGRRVESPTSVSGATRWVQAARLAPRLVAEHFAALSNGKTSPMKPDAQELAQMKHLQAPARRDPQHPELDTKFYVTGQYPSRLLYKRFMRTARGPVGFMARTMGIYTGTGLRGRKLASYDSFQEAQQAAKAMGGGWVYRVEPKAGLKVPTTRRWVMPREIMGGAYVNHEGQLAPLPIVNTHADAWATLLPDGKLGVAVDPSHGSWPEGLKPPTGYEYNKSTQRLEPVKPATTEPASKKRTLTRTAAATGAVLGVTAGVYEGVPRLLELGGVHVTPTQWLVAGVTAFTYRAWVASIKGGWKNGMLNRVRELRDPGLSPALRSKYIDTLERQLGQGPHPWLGQVLRGRMRGVPKSDREVIPELANLLRKGDPHLQALVLDQFEGYAGSLLARKSGIGKFQDFLRTLSFGTTFSRNAMTLFDAHAPATDVYQILSRHFVGNEGSLAGFIATASRYNRSTKPEPNRFTKALPAFSSLGDALSVVVLFGHDYLKIKGFHADGQDLYAALQATTIPVEVWLGKMLVNDFLDDIRGVWKNPDTPYQSRLMNTLFTPSAAPTRKIPPLIMLGPAALMYAGIALAPMFFDDPKDPKDPKGPTGAGNGNGNGNGNGTNGGNGGNGTSDPASPDLPVPHRGGGHPILFNSTQAPPSLLFADDTSSRPANPALNQFIHVDRPRQAVKLERV